MNYSIINIYIDEARDDANFLFVGEYEDYKKMLLISALTREDFGLALVDAALEYLDVQIEFLQGEKQNSWVRNY